MKPSRNASSTAGDDDSVGVASHSGSLRPADGFARVSRELRWLSDPHPAVRFPAPRGFLLFLFFFNIREVVFLPEKGFQNVTDPENDL